jgi:hypothetical protein
MFGLFVVRPHAHMRDFPYIGCSWLYGSDLEHILSPHFITEMRVIEVQVISLVGILGHLRRGGLRRCRG